MELEILLKVNDCFTTGDYELGFYTYMSYLSKIQNPERANHETQLSSVLFLFATDLIKENRISILHRSYKEVFMLFPESVKLMHDFGKFLMEIDCNFDAYTILEKAHTLDKNNLLIEKNLTAVKLLLVPRWHIRMLNDIKRNKVYFDAINSEITSKYNKILDIGAGSGFLSISASKNKNTKQIIAIEESECFSNICSKTIDCKDLAIYSRNSTSLNKGTIPLSNILVTEIFDTALFGEHVLETLIHAHENLLEADCKIVPSAADVYIMAIESPELQLKHTLLNRDIQGLYFGSLCVQEYGSPYDAHFIKYINFNKITEPYKFITVDFCNLEQLKSLHCVKNFIPKFNLSAIKTGIVQAFVVWFDLKLGNEKITTNPFDDDCCKCWEQAVIFPKHEFHVKEGENIEDLQFSCVEDILKLDIDKLISDCACITTSEEVITFLNDRELIDNICSVVHNFKVSHLHVLDLLPFPIFGILMAAKNNHAFTTSDDKELVHQLCLLNNIDEENITFITTSELTHLQSLHNMIDVIFFNPICTTGVINELFYAYYHLYVNLLKENGVILPQNVHIEFEIVSCEYFDYCQKVKEENVLGFEIPELINKFMVNEHLCVDKNLEYKPLTKPCRKFILNSNSKESVSSCCLEIEENGLANSILYWYTIDFYNNSYSTRNSLFYHKAAFIFEEPFNVLKGDKVKVDKKQQNGLIKLSCKL